MRRIPTTFFLSFRCESLDSRYEAINEIIHHKCVVFASFKSWPNFNEINVYELFFLDLTSSVNW